MLAAFALRELVNYAAGGVAAVQKKRLKTSR